MMPVRRPRNSQARAAEQVKERCETTSVRWLAKCETFLQHNPVNSGVVIAALNDNHDYAA